MSHPTIVDVARRAGVSKSLVSLVLRDSPHVTAEKRAAVHEAARELGYRPNAAARSLVRRRSYTLGVMVASLRNPFHEEVVEGITAAADEAGYRALITTGGASAGPEAGAVDTLLQLRTDGVVMTGSVLPPSDLATFVRTAPIVLVARPTRSREIDSVVNDDQAGLRLAVDHLVELGHRRIAHIYGTGQPAGRNRRRGYEAAMHANGLDRFVTATRGGFDEEGGARGMRALLANRHRPTAVVAANDLAAMGAMQVIAEEGLRIPGDISLVGYDNSWLAELRHIGLTTIHQPRHAMGRSAVALLLERIDGKRSTARHEVVEPSLVVRATTAPPP